jgi:excisionase family DNA binding protein
MPRSESSRTQKGYGQLLDACASNGKRRRGVASGPIPWLYTVPEVADVLRLSVRAVRRLIAQQKISTIHIGRAVRIREEALLAFIERK